MNTEQLVKTAISILSDMGTLYAETHERWLISTGIHPDFAEAIVVVALESIKHRGK